MTIAVAAKARGPLSQSELADRPGVEGATMVAMVDRLGEGGLVMREASTTGPAGQTHGADRRRPSPIYDKVKAEAAALRKELLAHTDPKKLLVATELLEACKESSTRCHDSSAQPSHDHVVHLLATIMQTLDSTIANVALPHMQGTLSASQDQIAWVLTAYIVAAAIATPLTGWLCDRFGQKFVFMASIAGFTLASVLCGMANSLAESSPRGCCRACSARPWCPWHRWFCWK